MAWLGVLGDEEINKGVGEAPQSAKDWGDLVVLLEYLRLMILALDSEA